MLKSLANAAVLLGLRMSSSQETPLIDCHLHAVSADRSRYRLQQADLPGNSWVLTNPASAEDLVAEMDSAGVRAGVLVQPVGAYGTDNSYVADATAIQAGPQRLGGVCVVDMVAQDRLAKLRYWTQDRKMGGVRLFSIPTPEVAWLDDPQTFEVWEACAEWGVRVSVCLLPAELENLGRVLRHFPEIPVALDHCGFVDVTDGPPWRNAAPLLELAEYGNLHLKITTNVLDAAGGSARQLLQTLNHYFGSNRLMWGSDYPQTHDRSYAQLVAFARSAAAILPSDAQTNYLGKTAQLLWPELG